MAKELKTILSLDSKPFADGMKKINSSMQKLHRGMQKFNKQIGAPLMRGVKNLAKLAAAAGVAAVAFGSMLTKKVANYGDELSKMNDKTGLSVQELARLQHAAKLSATDLSGLGKGMKGMALLLYEAERGTKTYTDVLDKLGVSFEDIKDLSPDKQLETLMSALADIEDPTKKAALAAKVFGRAGIDMLPMLSQGTAGLKAMKNEADDLGLVISDKQAANAVKFNDNIQRLKSSIFGLLMSSVAFEKINGYIELLKNKVIDLRKSGEFAKWASKVKDGAVTIIERIGTIIKKIWHLVKAVHNMSSNIIPIIAGVALAFKTGLAVPLIKMSAMIVKGLITTLLSPVGGVLLALAALFASLKLGEALEKSFDLSNYIAKGMIKLQGFGAKIAAFFKAIGPGFKEEFDAAKESINNETSNRLGMLGDPEGNGKTVGENFMDGMEESYKKGKDKLSKVLDKLLPKTNSVADFKLPQLEGTRSLSGLDAEKEDEKAESILANGVEKGMSRALSTNAFSKIFGGGQKSEQREARERSRTASEQLRQQKRTNSILERFNNQERTVFI